MHLLGHHLPDHKLLRVALTSFYGISHPTSHRLLARLQIPAKSRVADLTETQITALSAFLSSPSTTPAPAPTPLAQPAVAEGEAGPSGWARSERRKEPWAHIDLDDLKIETDLRRSVRADIAHQRQVGSYRGRRHALGLPVRGQNTRNNAHTAKKLNRVERRAYSSSTIQSAFTPKSVILSLLGR